VRPPARLLDVPCGHGRLALPLAARGYRVTGVDISRDLLSAARRSGETAGLAVDWRRGDMRAISETAAYDGAFCAGNSFGYFDDEGNAAFLRAVSRALVPGRRFVLDSGWTAECLFPNFRDSIEAETGGLRFLAENRYEPETGRVENRFTVSRGEETVTRLASHRAYACREILGLLRGAGMEVVETFGSLDEEPFRLGARRLLAVARKV
jgi:SAM-dependent methyltransferase